MKTKYQPKIEGLPKDRLILVTGAAGFIGSRFVESCQTQKFRVISVDKISHFTSRLEHKEIQFGEVVDREKLFEWLETNRPSLCAVVHLGACTNTMERNRVYLSEVNLEYSKRIWQYTATHRIPLVYASSAATYGDGSIGYNDDEKNIANLSPLNPYGESKQQFDLWALAQEREHHTPPCWSGFKFFNVYGFGERHKEKMASVVLHAFDQIQKTGTVRLFKSYREDIADGYQKRDFIYIDDVIQVLHFALRKPIQRGIFNLGTEEARTFLDLIRPVFQELRRPSKITFIEMPSTIRERYQYFTQANMHRLRVEGYSHPFTSLETGVQHYVKQLVTPQKPLDARRPTRLRPRRT